MRDPDDRPVGVVAPMDLTTQYVVTSYRKYYAYLVLPIESKICGSQVSACIALVASELLSAVLFQLVT